MEFVHELTDIIENIETMNGYLGDPEKEDFAISLIKEGTCFIAVKIEKGYRFYPSRFVGYLKNSYDNYTKHKEEVIRDTAPTLSQIFKHNPNPSQDLEMEYKKFCLKLGFTAKEKGEVGGEHKYWAIALEV
jgi:hypothetical protein